MNRPARIACVALVAISTGSCAGRRPGAAWPFFGPMIPPVTVVLRGDAPAPRDARFRVRAPDGETTAEDECPRDRYQGGCRTSADWYRGPGEYDLELRYRAVDDVEERVATRFVARGDEVVLQLEAYFEADGSTDRIDPRFLLESAPGVTVVHGGSGESDRLINEGPTRLFVDARDGHPTHSLWRVEPSGRWQRAFCRVTFSGSPAPRAWVALEPGASIDVGALREYAPSLPPGSYARVFGVTRGDVAQDASDSTSLVVDRVLVTGAPAPGSEAWHFGDLSGELPEFRAGPPTISTRAPRLDRPGSERPPGVEGATDLAHAPLVQSGTLVSTRLSSARPERFFRVRVGRGQIVGMRLFARCTESPCAAEIQRRVLSRHDTTRLHRRPPAWQTLDFQTTASERGEASFVLSCAGECVGVELYGRVYVLP